ncbi:MAG: CPBP family intramembrane metalloprotease [Acidobacteria bacterium]|nr:CPBP family intramembrane metalloprotease [Acidobacteriota bacterium]
MTATPPAAPNDMPVPAPATPPADAAAHVPPPAAPEDAAAPALPRPGRPWGFWATIGLALVVVMVQVFIVAMLTVVYTLLVPGTDGSELPANGLFLSVVFLASAPPCSALVVLFAWLRHKQYPLVEYLGLRRPRVRTVVGWVGVAVALVLAGDALSYAAGQPIVPPFMMDVYTTSVFPPLLFLTLIVLGPALEELLFRGFLLEGMRRSCVGPWVALVLTSALWAATHTQYNVYGIASIFFYGLLLGITRLRTNSLWTCFAMHAVTNALATAEVMVKVHLLD